MAIAPRVNEAKRREEEGMSRHICMMFDDDFNFVGSFITNNSLNISERKVLRDCYMYPARCKLSLTTRGARGDQRISVISSTSSNTTSGIVSDRVHSEDEPDTAPASTECLPRLTENSSHPSIQTGIPNGSETNTGDRSVPSPPMSIVDGRFRLAVHTDCTFVRYEKKKKQHLP